MENQDLTFKYSDEDFKDNPPFDVELISKIFEKYCEYHKLKDTKYNKFYDEYKEHISKKKYISALYTIFNLFIKLVGNDASLKVNELYTKNYLKAIQSNNLYKLEHISFEIFIKENDMKRGKESISFEKDDEYINNNFFIKYLNIYSDLNFTPSDDFLVELSENIKTIDIDKVKKVNLLVRIWLHFLLRMQLKQSYISFSLIMLQKIQLASLKAKYKTIQDGSFINVFTKDYKNERDYNKKKLNSYRISIFIVFAFLIGFAIVDVFYVKIEKEQFLGHFLIATPIIGLLIYLLRIEKNYLLEYKNNKEKYYKLNALIPFIQKIYAKKVENGIETQEDVLFEEAQKKDVFEIGKTFFNNSEVQDKSKNISLQDIEKISNILKVKEK